MRSPSGLAIIITLMLLVDFYIFQGLKTVSNPVSAKAKIIIYAIFLGFFFAFNYWVNCICKYRCPVYG